MPGFLGNLLGNVGNAVTNVVGGVVGVAAGAVGSIVGAAAGAVGQVIGAATPMVNSVANSPAGMVLAGSLNPAALTAMGGMNNAAGSQYGGQGSTWNSSNSMTNAQGKLVTLNKFEGGFWAKLFNYYKLDSDNRFIIENGKLQLDTGKIILHVGIVSGVVLIVYVVGKRKRWF